MVTWTQAAPWLARASGVVALVGLFLIVTPQTGWGFILFFYGVLVASVFWSLPRISSHPGQVAILAVGLTILGLVWTWWNVLIWAGGCPGIYDCLPVFDTIVNTLLFGGPAVAAAGIAMFASAMIRRRNAQRAQPAPGSRTSVAH